MTGAACEECGAQVRIDQILHHEAWHETIMQALNSADDRIRQHVLVLDLLLDQMETLFQEAGIDE